MSTIRYFNDGSAFRLPHKKIITEWLRQTASREGFTAGDINYIFCAPEKHIEINRRFLGHDYFTDVITFDYSDLDKSRTVSGEIYIDTRTVEDNAGTYGTTPLHEMHRVMVHGVLHLCGYKDKTPSEAETMRSKENTYLELLSEIYDRKQTKE